MNKLLVRVSATAATILAAGLMVAPATLADNGCTVAGNGARSNNKCKVTVNRTNVVSQTNSASVVNSVSVVSNTGGNKANNNTTGDVSISSGNSNVTVSITNVVNGNAIVAP